MEPPFVFSCVGEELIGEIQCCSVTVGGIVQCQATMRALNLHHSQSLPVWLSVPVRLAVFLSPTAYALSLMIIDRLQTPAPPEGLVALLFCLVPVVALLACGTVVWRSQRSLRWRLGGLVLTVLAMLLQCGVWFVINVSAITAVIAPAQ